MGEERWQGVRHGDARERCQPLLTDILPTAAHALAKRPLRWSLRDFYHLSDCLSPFLFSIMARTKQTARNSTGGKAPRAHLSTFSVYDLRLDSNSYADRASVLCA